MAVATLVASLVLTFCRVATPSPRLLVMATAFVPLAVVGYLVAIVACWSVRRLSDEGHLRRAATVALVVSGVGVAVHVALLVPSYAGAHGSGSPALTVMTSNLRLGRADVGDVAAVAADEHADVIVLEEVTPQELEQLAELRRSYPYLTGRAAPGAYGTVVLSRYPLSGVSQLHVSKGAWLMTVAAPRPFRLVAVHTSQPLTSQASWVVDHAALLAAVRRLDGPLVVAGDLNATLDHRPVRRLLGTGLSDAARTSNSGWQPTWPVSEDTGRLWPLGLGLMTLDHVLVSHDFSVISTSTHRVTGSDHRALVARLARS